MHICIFETNCEQRYQRWSDDIFYIQFSVQIEILLYQVEILIHLHTAEFHQSLKAFQKLLQILLK